MASGSGESTALPKRPPGFINSAQHLLGVASEYVLIRTELAGIESKNSLRRFAQVALFFGVAVLFLGSGFLYLSLSLIYVLAEKLGWGWGLALLATGGLLLLLTLISFLLARRALGGEWFPITLSELKKDTEWLKQQKMPKDSGN